jgi:histidine triad (HIT) family protein
VIPKGPYVNFDHFAAEASAEELLDFHRTAARIVDMLNLSPGAGAAGYRSIANAGDHGHQEVPHYHLHILAGRPLGPMLTQGSFRPVV